MAALLHNPRVISLDELTKALNLIHAMKKMREFIRGRDKKEKYTVILTSHNMANIEQGCERVLMNLRSAYV